MSVFCASSVSDTDSIYMTQPETISLGSTFRFQDLKALLYRDEQNESAVQAGIRPAIQPETFELLVNYRSHGGIVDCASSVIRLLSKLFPNSIDDLKPETAVVDGPKPCVFRGWNNDVFHFEQFLFGGEYVYRVVEAVPKLIFR